MNIDNIYATIEDDLKLTASLKYVNFVNCNLTSSNYKVQCGFHNEKDEFNDLIDKKEYNVNCEGNDINQSTTDKTLKYFTCILKIDEEIISNYTATFNVTAEFKLVLTGEFTRNVTDLMSDVNVTYVNWDNCSTEAEKKTLKCGFFYNYPNLDDYSNLTAITINCDGNRVIDSCKHELIPYYSCILYDDKGFVNQVLEIPLPPESISINYIFRTCTCNDNLSTFT